MFKMKVDLTKDPILKSLLIFAFPLFVANVFQQLYNTMDTMIVGIFRGYIIGGNWSMWCYL